MNKNILIMLLMLICMIGVSFAAIGVTTVSPAASGIVSGQYTLKQAITGMSGASTVNITWSVTSTLTGASSTINATTNLNATTAGNLTFASSGLEDANDYVFTVTVKNNTASAESATASSSSVVVDNTAPDAPSSCTTTNFANTTYRLQCTVVAATTSSCTITFPSAAPKSSIGSLTQSGSSCYIDIVGSGTGTFQYYMTASDGTNTSAGTPVYYSAKGKSRNGDSSAAEAAALSIIGNGGNVQTMVSSELSVPELSKTVAGMAGGFALGTIVPGIGNMIGLVVGGVIGFIL